MELFELPTEEDNYLAAAEKELAEEGMLECCDYPYEGTYPEQFRTYFDLINIRAIQEMGMPPQPGMELHVICKHTFNPCVLFDKICWTHPDIKWNVAMASMNTNIKANKHIENHIRNGKIVRLDCILSDMCGFLSQGVVDWEKMRSLCEKTGGQFVCTQSHAKIFAFLAEDESKGYTILSSANLSGACKFESFVVYNSANLTYSYYHSVIDYISDSLKSGKHTTIERLRQKFK